MGLLSPPLCKLAVTVTYRHPKTTELPAHPSSFLFFHYPLCPCLDSSVLFDASIDRAQIGSGDSDSAWMGSRLHSLAQAVAHTTPSRRGAQRQCETHAPMLMSTVTVSAAVVHMIVTSIYCVDVNTIPVSDELIRCATVRLSLPCCILPPSWLHGSVHSSALPQLRHMLHYGSGRAQISMHSLSMCADVSNLPPLWRIV